MKRALLGMLSLTALLSAGIYLALPAQPTTVDKAFEPAPVTGLLPTLDDENSPFFSRQMKSKDGHKTEDIYCYRHDRSVVHLYYGNNSLLTELRAFRNSDDKLQIAYEAQYDSSGRRIKTARSYEADGSLKSLLERHADGSESYSFYKGGQLVQQVELANDGFCTTSNYENGKLKSTDRKAPPARSTELLFWDAGKKSVRLRVNMLGARLASWEYLNRDGSLEHRGQVLADGSLEFSYMDKGKLKRRQIWRLVGEDWERSYYGLSSAEILADDEKTVENRIWVRSNGSLKRHERYDAKTGRLEMQRDFDLESRVARVEDFKKDGTSERVWEFPASGNRSRGFVPDGLRVYPGEEKDLGSVYNLDGSPFSHSVLDLHPWAFFQVPAAVTQSK